jgi:hypothetical protein
LAIYLLWLNLHGGFVFGLALFLCHTIEQCVRRRPVQHLALVGLAMLALIAVNPYGLAYYSYLWRALRMDRSLITEWAPIWAADGSVAIFYVSLYLLSLVVVGYAAHRVGARNMPGLILVLITAYIALWHQRLLSIYAVVWLCLVPGYVQLTPLGDALTGLWTRRRRMVLTLGGVLGVLSMSMFILTRPWDLPLPANHEDNAKVVYPVGAVVYLEQVAFRGNLMVPFASGAYVTWKLYPDVKVSIDTRYEVAYPPEALRESVAFYSAKPGWEQTLVKFPTDAVLVTTAAPVSAKMTQAEGWRQVYCDDVFEIYARPGLTLPKVDWTGEKLVGTFP